MQKMSDGGCNAVILCDGDRYQAVFNGDMRAELEQHLIFFLWAPLIEQPCWTDQHHKSALCLDDLASTAINCRRLGLATKV